MAAAAAGQGSSGAASDNGRERKARGRPSVVPGLRIVQDGGDAKFPVPARQPVGYNQPGSPPGGLVDDGDWEVQTPGGSTVTTAVSATQAPALLENKRVIDMFRASSGLGGNKKKRAVYSMRIVIANQTASAAATPSAPVYAIEPTLSSEIATMSALWSEFRVKPQVHFMYNVGWSGVPLQQMLGVCYDPVYGTARVSVSECLQASQCQLTGFGPNVSPAAMDTGGYRHFKVRLLSGAVTNGSVAGLAGADQWMPMNSTAGKFGYISFYVPSGGSGITSTIQSYMMVDLEFRNRV